MTQGNEANRTVFSVGFLGQLKAEYETLRISVNTTYTVVDVV